MKRFTMLAPLTGCIMAVWSLHAQAYITAPVTTLGQCSGWSTYVTVVRVDKVSKEKGVIVYRKVQDLKGKYPKEVIKHVFDLKNTPAHHGPGDVPVRPDAKDWQYAVQWAEPGKTAVIFTLKYDPYGDFGHTYIDGCWYAIMCPRRDWEFWYSIYSDPALLSRWHGGTPAQLASALEVVLAGKEAVVPVMVGGSREDLRQGRAKLQGLKVSTSIHDYNPKRDLVAGWLGKQMVPSLIKSLQHANRDQRIKAVRELGLIGPEAKEAVPGLLALVHDQDDELRLAALNALGQIGAEAKAALPAFLAALKDRNPLMRRSATRGLGQWGAPAKAAVPELTALLVKSESLDRLEIAEALVRIDPANQAALSTLAGLLRDAQVETRFQALEILAQAGAAAKEAEPALIEVLKEPDVGLRLRTIEVLGQTGLAAPEVLATATALYADPNKDIRLRAGAVLSQLGPAAAPAVPTLLKAMKDPDREVRILTADLIGQIGPAAKAAVATLAAVVGNDASGTVRMHAADALAKLGPEAKAARPALQAALADPRMAQRKEVLDKIAEVAAKLK